MLFVQLRIAQWVLPLCALTARPAERRLAVSRAACRSRRRRRALPRAAAAADAPPSSQRSPPARLVGRYSGEWAGASGTASAPSGTSTARGEGARGAHPSAACVCAVPHVHTQTPRSARAATWAAGRAAWSTGRASTRPADGSVYDGVLRCGQACAVCCRRLPPLPRGPQRQGRGLGGRGADKGGPPQSPLRRAKEPAAAAAPTAPRRCHSSSRCCRRRPRLRPHAAALLPAHPGPAPPAPLLAAALRAQTLGGPGARAAMPAAERGRAVAEARAGGRGGGGRVRGVGTHRESLPLPPIVEHRPAAPPLRAVEHVLLRWNSKLVAWCAPPLRRWGGSSGASLCSCPPSSDARRYGQYAGLAASPWLTAHTPARGAAPPPCSAAPGAPLGTPCGLRFLVRAAGKWEARSPL